MDIRKTEAFDQWLARLRDRQARARIVERLRRFERGNPGDVSPIGEGVSEMRIHFGPGYRIYFVRQGQDVVVLLCGGDKDSQAADITRAKEMAREV